MKPDVATGGGGASLSEWTVEAIALDWLESLGWAVAHGPDIAPDARAAERADYGEVVLSGRLRSALACLNPDLPANALEDAQRRLTRPAGATLEARNRDFHRMVVAGVTVEYVDTNGRVRGAQVRVLDFDEPDANDWFAVNQFTVVENRHERRPDIVLFVNGLPLAVVELKNPVDEDATVWSAFQQLQTYKAEIPSLFVFNAALIVSDGLEARIGTLTAGREWCKPWRTISGEALADPSLPQLQVLLEGVFTRRRLLALVRDFIVFEDDGSGDLVKKMAGYHQFHAVQTAVAETLRAAALQHAVADRDPHGRYESARQPGGGARGDRRIGVVWHTQGSGKSLTMAFYAGRIVREPAMENPTIVVLTDRNDLDDQLFTTFSRCADLLRQPPVQAKSRADLRAKLAVESGGVVFTTIQKFFPEEKGDRHPLLSNRRNCNGLLLVKSGLSGAAALGGGHPRRAARPATGGARAHPRPGERQGTLPDRGARTLAGLRPRRAARRGRPHPRRCRVLPGRAHGPVQARRRRGQDRRGARPRRAPDRLARGGAGGRRGHLRRRRPRQA